MGSFQKIYKSIRIHPHDHSKHQYFNFKVKTTFEVVLQNDRNVYLFDLGAGLHAECNTFHIAEGPGGFMEAMCELRGLPSDEYVGITLTDDNNYSIPGWKKAKISWKSIRM